MSDVILGPVDDVPPGEGRTFAVDGDQIAVFRMRDGSLRAIDAVCPHRGGPLADGLTDESVVVCPLHGHTFDLCSGLEPGGDLAVRSYPVTVDADGSISLRLQRD